MMHRTRLKLNFKSCLKAKSSRRRKEVSRELPVYLSKDGTVLMPALSRMIHSGRAFTSS